MHRPTKSRWIWCPLAGCLLLAAAWGGLTVKAADPAASLSAAAQEARFDRLYAEWKSLVLELHQLQLAFLTASESARDGLRREYDEKLAAGDEMVVQMTEAAKALSHNGASRRDDLDKFMMFSAAAAAFKDDYELAQELLEPLETREPLDEGIYELAGRVAFALADGERAEKYLKLAAEKLKRDAETMKLPAEQSVLGEAALRDLSQAAAVTKAWQRELEFRAADAEAGDLPRVLLHTTQGDMTLELFEDQAPNTVANFVRLVEDKYYNDTTFFRVESSFVAQGGDPLGNSTGGPGYKIACECGREDHREHFRGSISMAHAGKDTGGSQFFLSFRPALGLNGKHTVFGRIIDGLDVLAKLKRMDDETRKTTEPDRVISATVLRKRDHEYVPERL
ncbi:MAG: peptidylprolyl isomerase [Pirellulales bacterium]